ncbi:hypothetical protein [Delftia sp.]|uniref:hypothetical protein n=1 Tax=Delftia sp. TaxID=1886637 RepID=UPI00257B23D4|nr:hypothetical protein [Delftia sp.]MPT55006.1 hypothetical protein [Delftia sp.]
MTNNVSNIADHMALTCDCGSVHFSLLRSDGIECNSCGKRQPMEWREYDAHECPECGGAGKKTVYHDVSHQLGKDSLPFLDECEACAGLGWCGPDAEKRAAIAKKPQALQHCADAI